MKGKSVDSKVVKSKAVEFTVQKCKVQHRLSQGIPQRHLHSWLTKRCQFNWPSTNYLAVETVSQLSVPLSTILN